MTVLSNLQDKFNYTLHKLTYDPEAERYNESVRAAREAEEATRRAKEKKEKAATEAKATEESKAAAKAKEAEERAARSEFRTDRFVGKVAGIVTTILFVFALVVGGLYGAHLATNLNLYRSWPYRLLYAVYGFIFFPIVIVYVLGYRWWWKGKKPQYYAFLPLIPYFINQPVLASLFSWLSYRPDDEIAAFKEWKNDRD